MDVAAINEILRKVQKTANPEEVRAWRFSQEILLPLKLGGFQDRETNPEFVAPWNDFSKGNDTQRSQAKALDRLKALFQRRGAIVILAGKRGTGKTTLAAQIAAWGLWSARKAVENHDPYRPFVAFYRKLSDVMGKLKPLYLSSGAINLETLEAERRRLTTNSLLVLDEIHEGEDTELKSTILTDLCDRAYASRSDVLLITNESPDDVKMSVGDSVRSRLNDHGAILGFRGEDLRKNH